MGFCNPFFKKIAMRYGYFFLLLLLAAGCKKKIEPEPYLHAWEKPMGVLSVEAEGIPKENVRFTKLDREDRDRIVITLPQDYPANAPIKLKFQLVEGFSLAGNSSSIDLVDYNGKSRTISVMNSGNVATSIPVIVNPTSPIIVPVTGRSYEFTLQNGNPVMFSIPVSNWGTAGDMIYWDELFIRNKATGETTSTALSFSRDTPDALATLSIPASFPAGEYELTVVRGTRRTVIPDPLILRYGRPIIHFQSANAFENADNTVRYSGYNLTSENTYRLELKNDFLPARQFDLSPINHLWVGAQLPSDLPTGNYEATLYVNDEAVQNSNLLTGVYLVYARKDEFQPVIGLVSKLSNSFDVMIAGQTFFNPAKSFSRDDELIMHIAGYPKDIGNTTNVEVRLFLKNITTGKEYEPQHTGIFRGIGALPYYQYAPPGDIPAGDYEVRAGVYVKTQNELHISERYHQAIRIE